jgi:Fe-S-cluster-containing dehydrogenase component
MKRQSDQLHAIAHRHEVTRREALELIGVGVAALSAGCVSRAGDEKIVPYAIEPPEHRPGRMVPYASTLALDGFSTGIVVETHEGRPTKIDGNPAHPASAGGSLAWMQARILDLYDPQRASTASIAGAAASWAAIAARLQRLPPGPLWIVMPPQSSPTIARLLEQLGAGRELHVLYYAALDHRSAYRGSALACGRPCEVQLALSRADVVLALDADFMAAMPMSAAWARAVALRRGPDLRMNRIWACEPMETPTGTLADERLAVPAGDVAAIATCVLAELGMHQLAVPRLRPELVAKACARAGAALSWVRGIAADLAAHRGASAVVVGDRQPPIVHALARWIDHACGNIGTTVELTDPVLHDPVATTSLAGLAQALRAGAHAIVIDCDPIYSAPNSLGLGAAFAASPFTLHVGLHQNATTRACTASMPLAHDLETWSDGRAWDGTLAFGQPLVRPRFEVVSAIDVLAALLNDPRDSRTHVREQLGDDAAWQSALRTGVVDGTRAVPLRLPPTWTSRADEELARAIVPAVPLTIEVALGPSPQVHDGRFAPNAWLQELPHPITKQTWGNAALLGPAMAERLGVRDEDCLEIETAASRVRVPVIVVPGGADGSITIELGHGQRAPAVPIANGVGVDAFALRSDDRLVLRGTVRRVAGHARVARTQTTFTEEGRELAPVATLAGFSAAPQLVAHLRGEQVSLLPAQPRDGTQWGMSIDTSICTGCSACMVACQAENNIPTVGPEQVVRGRHMNWLRVDRYVKDGGVVVNEPMPCQHCENAPCEYVCPVNATTHSPDGLNEQVYNRCVGTRFCSNNCPYKVRRFNWFAPEPPTTRALQYNPDVTVRSRGVMEKCTYCVQRIRRAEQAARVEHRELGPGEVATACQQACPTGAIVFGELHEQGTVFARLRTDARRFDVLHELGTRPRTQYLAKIRNPKGPR